MLAGTFMFAIIYLAIGALVGTLVASPVNGTVLIFFVWITDIMFGPVFVSPTGLAGRVFPTHFRQLVDDRLALPPRRPVTIAGQRLWPM